MPYVYEYPLSPDARWQLFRLWCDANPVMLGEMEQKAVSLEKAGHKHISAQYLMEWARYELPYKSVPIPYRDGEGKMRSFRINNNDAAALGRWLVMRHPELPIELRKSALDERAQPCTS